jgi:hypothetical protein
MGSTLRLGWECMNAWTHCGECCHTPVKKGKALDIDLGPLPVDERVASIEHFCRLLDLDRWDFYWLENRFARECRTRGQRTMLSEDVLVVSTARYRQPADTIPRQQCEPFASLHSRLSQLNSDAAEDGMQHFLSRLAFHSNPARGPT